MSQKTQATKTSESRLRQGDILRDVEWIECVEETAGIVEVLKVIFPLAIVLTQDCDLNGDYRVRTQKASSDDKRLISALLAPIYNVEHVYQGMHLSELEIKMEPVPKGRTAGTYLRSNQRPRYHYLEFADDIPIVPSVIDFKHYFSATVSYLMSIKLEAFVCSIASLFREEISHRFAAYLARVGLPEPADPPGADDETRQ